MTPLMLPMYRTKPYAHIICNISQIRTIYTLGVKGVVLAMENLVWLKTNVHRDVHFLNVCNMQEPAMPMDFRFGVWGLLNMNHFVRYALENS